MARPKKQVEAAVEETPATTGALTEAATAIEQVAAETPNIVEQVANELNAIVVHADEYAVTLRKGTQEACANIRQEFGVIVQAFRNMGF